MKKELTAEDLYPLIGKLSSEEQLRLAYYALRVRASLTERGDAAAYERHPVAAAELGAGSDDGLSWDAEGWDDVA